MFLPGMAGLPLRQAVEDLNLVVIMEQFRSQYFDDNMTVESVPMISLGRFAGSHIGGQPRRMLTLNLLQARPLRNLPSPIYVEFCIFRP